MADTGLLAVLAKCGLPGTATVAELATQLRTGSISIDLGLYEWGSWHVGSTDDLTDQGFEELEGRQFVVFGSSRGGEERHVLSWNESGYQTFRWGIFERELLDAGTFRELLMDVHEEVAERVAEGERGALPDDLVELHVAAGLA